MNAKRCHVCTKDKPINEFSPDRSKKDGVSNWCKSCKSTYEKERRSRNREYILKKDRERSLVFSKKVHTYMGGKCEICGLDEDFPPMYQCHHVNPDDKDIGISRLRHKKGAWKEKVVPELNKCVYLCANCHAKLHWGYFNNKLRKGELVLIPRGFK